MADLDGLADLLRELWPKAKEEKINQVLAFIEGDELVYDVEIPGARVGITTRDIGGLPITFDAMGNAVSVEFPVGGMAS